MASSLAGVLGKGQEIKAQSRSCYSLAKPVRLLTEFDITLTNHTTATNAASYYIAPASSRNVFLANK
jgi:hypothetical protein